MYCYQSLLVGLCLSSCQLYIYLGVYYIFLYICHMVYSVSHLSYYLICSIISVSIFIIYQCIFFTRFLSSCFLFYINISVLPIIFLYVGTYHRLLSMFYCRYILGMVFFIFLYRSVSTAFFL